MPLDFTNYNKDTKLEIPENLDFNIELEPTRMKGKFYVINDATEEVLGIVGNNYNTLASHKPMLTTVWDTMCEELTEDDLEGANIKFRSARNNAFAMMDITLPNVTSYINTDKHETKMFQRFVALHGVDGMCSNQVFHGLIDGFCTNGMVTGEHDHIRRKNTTNFTLAEFQRELRQSRNAFDESVGRIQKMADTSTVGVDVKALLEKIIKSDRKAEKMYNLYNAEATTRGRNVFSLMSAFTNYSTYADDRNGFNLRNTGNDTNVVSMFAREHEVSKWMSAPEFKELMVA